MSPLYEGKRVRELYEGFTSTLQYKAYHKPPGKRLIGEVQTLQEEISACLKVLQGQEEFAADFKAVLSPRSFRISTSFQSLQYREFIKPAANALLKDIRDERKKLMHLMGRLNMIEQKARYRIELLEEDNSKAIFIFTLVTVIFLPLSFVTSYMGMNTADIRDTNKTQGTFWAAALPTTVVVLSVTMLLAYNASAIREWLFDARLEWSEHRQRPRRGHAGRVSFGSLHFASWRGGRKRDDGDPGAGPV
ncbi:uncharacterized protein K452DRAFT_287526 [Aplosporella prunicola CBS 121167]|uniref:Uncharacterized protein n=1 Tax=Aplosporella prunicola CBS 121167 TaxID=1176127 RepID=A0A6A6BE35_9PEZI|nr:uncharacterized protein K452DRAFT_287526 [Aplosporella prunicola CBS 121167]KAF2141565.1 hypothetical protein K452DRAFT_287526 [Aplosporella prunicola CBS 121167]